MIREKERKGFYSKLYIYKHISIHTYVHTYISYYTSMLQVQLLLHTYYILFISMLHIYEATFQNYEMYEEKSVSEKKKKLCVSC
jgi:hypothetical protein